jgi:heme exporter protein B
MIGEALLVAGKDLRVELRSRVGVNQVLPFVLAVVMLFAFALDPDSGVLRRATSGVFWVTVVFVAVLLVQRAFAIEHRDGVADALRLSGLSPAGIFLGKVVALAVQLVVVEVALLLGVVVLYDARWQQPGLIGVTIATATVAIAAAGAIYGPLSAGLRMRETALPLLLLPALAPVLLAATRSFEISAGRALGNGWQWVAMLGIVAVLYLLLGALCWGPILEET